MCASWPQACITPGFFETQQRGYCRFVGLSCTGSASQSARSSTQGPAPLSPSTPITPPSGTMWMPSPSASSAETMYPSVCVSCPESSGCSCSQRLSAIICCSNGRSMSIVVINASLGKRQGCRPETRLRDSIPQTPFFASRGIKRQRKAQQGV